VARCSSVGVPADVDVLGVSAVPRWDSKNLSGRCGRGSRPAAQHSPDIMQRQLWDRPSFETCEDERRALVALSLVPGVGAGRIRILTHRFGSPSAVLRAGVRQLEFADTIGPQTARSIASFDAWQEVDRQFERAHEIGARLILEGDHDYPALLREIYDGPPILWVRGDADLNQRCVAVVGTRRPSDYGRRTAAELVEALSAAGIAVVSGFAYGIDTVAHDRTVASGGVTIGVLGSGVDVIYPTRNSGLASRMLAGDSSIISEFPLGAKPDAPNFPKRNRIVSGLSIATIIVEAYEQGGALITARLALEQNRDVFAVPGPINSPVASGTNMLIRDGHAELVTSVDDLLSRLCDADVSTVARPTHFALDELPLNEARLLENLTDEPIHIDTLCARCDFDTSVALVNLLELEFKGLVRQLGGKHFVRA
jgi:DNA processing protein